MSNDKDSYISSLLVELINNLIKAARIAESRQKDYEDDPGMNRRREAAEAEQVLEKIRLNTVDSILALNRLNKRIAQSS